MKQSIHESLPQSSRNHQYKRNPIAVPVTTQITKSTLYRTTPSAKLSSRRENRARQNDKNPEIVGQKFPPN
jgi:hypothetical protein